MQRQEPGQQEDMLSANAFDLSINDDLGSNGLSITSGSNQVAAGNRELTRFFFSNIYFRPLPSLQPKPLPPLPGGSV